MKWKFTDNGLFFQLAAYKMKWKFTDNGNWDLKSALNIVYIFFVNNKNSKLQNETEVV